MRHNVSQAATTALCPAFQASRQHGIDFTTLPGYRSEGFPELPATLTPTKPRPLKPLEMGRPDAPQDHLSGAPPGNRSCRACGITAILIAPEAARARAAIAGAEARLLRVGALPAWHHATAARGALRTFQRCLGRGPAVNQWAGTNLAPRVCGTTWKWFVRPTATRN